MSKAVLLARPHALIVAEMKPLLQENSFSITALERLADLPARLTAIHAYIVGVDSVSTSALPEHETFLYFSKEDLAQPARRSLAAKLIQRHFR